MDAENREKAATDRYLIVTTAVADIRKEPTDGPTGYGHDDLQESQALYNEVLLYRGENEKWYRVEAIEQADFSPESLWHGHPGWVKKTDVLETKAMWRNNVVVRDKTAKVLHAPINKARALHLLSIGTRLRATGKIVEGYEQVQLPGGVQGWVRKRCLRRMVRQISEDRLRSNIVNTAKLFLGVPYLWGGRSMLLPELGGVATGVDCSGLTSLVFRANNIDIPRNAHVQWMVTPKIAPAALRPGDLIFLSNKDEFYKINHVMIFVRGDEFIEAAETGTVVKVGSFKEKFGRTRAALAAEGLLVDNRRIYCGKIPVSK
jgi:cell wall-associated NlpC family hydrolase